MGTKTGPRKRSFKLPKTDTNALVVFRVEKELAESLKLIAKIKEIPYDTLLKKIFKTFIEEQLLEIEESKEE